MRREKTITCNRDEGKTPDNFDALKPMTAETSGEIMGEVGQLEFETTMHWSPTKRTRKKKLEAIDTDEENEDTSSEGEEGEINRSKRNNRTKQEEEGDYEHRGACLVWKRGYLRWEEV